MMLKKEIVLTTAKVLLLGFTFKENCPDIRNTKVMDIYREFCQFGLTVHVYDPIADPEEVNSRVRYTDFQ